MQNNTILLVEDDEFVSKAYKYFLEDAGYRVVLVQHGAEALSAVKKSKPGLVLLDLLMPGINGFEVLGAIKSDQTIKNIPVIIVSNLSQDSDVKICKQMGAADYLVKSNFTMKEVIKKIERYVSPIPIVQKREGAVAR